MTLTKNLLERLRDNSNKEGFQVVQNENFQASIPNNFPGVSDLVSNELALISDIVKSDVSLSSYHSRNSKLYELLDLLVKSLENIVIKHDDLVKYLVTMDKQESYLPVLFNSNKKAIETIMSLDSCLTYQSSATSSFIPQERLMELVLDSKNNIERLKSFNQHLDLLACQLNEASNLVNNLDEPYTVFKHMEG